jgi:hypothetical protein
MAEAPAPGDGEFARMKKRANRIWQNADPWRNTLDSIHEYMMPMRRNADKSGGTPSMDRIFDGTGPKANFRFAGRVQADLTPPDERFFVLEPGSAIVNENDKKQLAAQLEPITNIVDATFSTGTWHTASHEMYADLFAGQGAMLTNPGDGDDIVQDVAVPAAEVALEADPYNRVNGVVWRKDYCADYLPQLFPKARFSDELMQQIKSEQDKKIEVTQYTARDYETRRWHHRAIVGNETTFAKDENSRTSPWLTPRFFVVPGMPHGFGPAHLALPFVKTANKARELALKAAAFSLLGLWAQRDDGVFDPDTARFHPGAFWKMGSTGGPLGPSVARLEMPGDFDISTVVLNDERDQIKQATFDDTLPPIAGAVRSPTEIVERMRRLDMDWAGVDGRLGLEIVRAAVARRLDILEQKKILPTKLTIDQLLVRCSIVSPIARARRTRAAQTIVEGLTLVKSIAGPEMTMLVSEIEEACVEILRQVGVPEKLIRSKTDRAQLQKMVAGIIAAQQQAAAGAEAQQ